MEKYICDQNNGLWYELQGNSYIPCLVLNEQIRPLGVWGRKCLQYLKENYEGVYTGLLISGKLNSYLADVGDRAADMLDRLVQQMAMQQGVNEQLKAQNQLEWVQRMNSIRNAAEEIVIAEEILV